MLSRTLVSIRSMQKIEKRNPLVMMLVLNMDFVVPVHKNYTTQQNQTKLGE